ncbi:MAG TPA: beta-L-arabinofuranosidase domain-containing protein [Phycisphaerae bacterium]|nr:beta-L-arabinofuranosidase domain-containing protein [Phycisphaerae bacterium]
MKATLRPMPMDRVKVLDWELSSRARINRDYCMSLASNKLLQNYYLEAGLSAPIFTHEGGFNECYWGWESPTCQVRGSFLGHWLSAAARTIKASGDAELKLKADHIVSELRRCQEKNGGQWVGPIPEKYLHWTADHKPTWAPQYVIHKLLMGLIDMHVHAASEQALEILNNLASWFHDWAMPMPAEQWDDVLDVETGGMLESWADLYAVTGKDEHLDLVNRYYRRRLFDKLLDGKDVLTNMHANTTVPEIQGAARAYEVTGEKRWRDVVEAYWKLAVTDRGYYCTGGQTCGEVWSAPFRLAARLGDKTQEHCVVYNMMRLAEYLLRWTAAAEYADYWERNLYNGILAQQHPRTGMMTYFLPLEPGSAKKWGTPTDSFWCCYGTLVQAHTLYPESIYYADDDGLVIAQYLASELNWPRKAGAVKVTMTEDFQANPIQALKNEEPGSPALPASRTMKIAVECQKPARFAIKLRLPEWLAGKAKIAVNGKAEPIKRGKDGFAKVERTWRKDTIRIELPRSLWTCPLPDEPDTVAFMDGPVVLAGLCDHEPTLRGDKDHPETMLRPDREREWGSWFRRYRLRGQADNFCFIGLHQVVDERYTVYFPVEGASGNPRRRGRR